MKKLLLFFSLFVAGIVTAQSPHLLNYQGVARDATGTVISSGNIGIRFEIWRTSTSGTKVYQEEMSTTPSAAGIFTTSIGSGTNTIGTFSTIPWANGPYYIVVGIDPTGGTSFSTVGASQLLSVPYALYAEKAGNAQVVNINQSGVANVLGTYPNYTVDVAAPNLNYNSGTQVLTLTQGAAVSSATLTGSSSGTVSMFANGIASVSPVGAGNNFTVSVQTPSFTGAGSTTVTGTYPNYLIQTPPASTVASIPNNFQINPPHSTTTLSPGNYSINIVPTSITGPGVIGSYPTYTVTSAPATTVVAGTNVTVGGTGPVYTVNATPSLSIGSGSISITGGNSVALPIPPAQTSVTAGTNIIVNGSAPSYTINATVPTLSLTGSTLTSGPSTNSVNLSSLSVWSNSVGVLYPTILTNSVGIGTSTVSSVLDVTGNSTLTVGRFTNSTNTGGAVITADHIGGSSAAIYYGVKANANAIGGTTYGLYGSAGGGGTAYGVYGSMNGAGGYGVYGIAPAGGIGVGVAGISNAGSTASAFGVFGSSLNSFGGQFQNSTGTITASFGGQTYSGLFSGGNVGINVLNPGYRLSVLENSFNTAAVYGAQTSAAGSPSAHGIYGLSSNTNTFAAGIFGESNGNGPGIFGYKNGGSGPAARFEQNVTGNSADAVFAFTGGTGSAIHTKNNNTAGANNLGVIVEDGHIGSLSVAPPTVGGTACTACLSGSLQPQSNDIAGTFSYSMTASYGAPYAYTITFNKPYRKKPIVVISPVTPVAAVGNYYITIVGVVGNYSGFTINWPAGISAGAGAASFNYIIIESSN